MVSDDVRKVVLYTLTSVDGAVDDPRRHFADNDPTVASAPVFDQVMADLEAEVIGRQDAVLLVSSPLERRDLPAPAVTARC